MANPEIILESLEAVLPEGLCDDHLSAETGIAPRQQVNQICRRLAERGAVVREKGTCLRGERGKIVNRLKGRADHRREAAAVLRETGPATYGAEPAARASDRPIVSEAAGPRPLDRSWRHIDRFARRLWGAKMKEKAPMSLAAVLTRLRDDEIISSHAANMMHTVRGLRNEQVHGDSVFGRREYELAALAYGIVEEWAKSSYGSLWAETAG